MNRRITTLYALVTFMFMNLIFTETPFSSRCKFKQKPKSRCKSWFSCRKPTYSWYCCGYNNISIVKITTNYVCAKSG